MVSVRLEGVTKRFGSVVAVEQLSLHVEAGELFFLLGPSGCGKSTALRLIAGLEAQDCGEIYFDDQPVSRVPTQRRNAVMVFQDYALWPHMTVAQNVRFGLEARGEDRGVWDQRVRSALQLVQLESLADRRPGQLSGGQQQRVALARALAVQPEVLLLDEPLSNLDAQLRVQMRYQIRQICKRQGLTAIYVTHDQQEALSTADRIGVLNAGRLVQVGTPVEVYSRPASLFVARFMGLENIVEGQLVEAGAGSCTIRCPWGLLQVERVPQRGWADPRCWLVAPPTAWRLGAGQVNTVRGRLERVSYLGRYVEAQVQCEQAKILAHLPAASASALATGEVIQMWCAPQELLVLKDQT